MSDIAIRVENLSKRYRIGLKEEAPDTLLGALRSWVDSPRANYLRLRKLSHFIPNGMDIEDVIWALKDVSFEVKRGELLGIIGSNGAGKSTLLKILSRITEPTSGRAIMNGRVSSLLEVGTGFHSDLTGRENVYLNGTVLGMSKQEIDRKFYEIVEFSGVEKFIDTPVKRYSSGMQVRLAFSVAAHLEPEILLVDEVLAVGDVSFQKKCLGKMGEVAKKGRTVLFVSHNMGAVRSLCGRCILLSQGLIAEAGSTDDVISEYLAESIKGIDNSAIFVWEKNGGSSEEVSFNRVELLDEKGSHTSFFAPNEPILLKIKYRLNMTLPGLRIVIQLRTITGEIAFTSTDHSERELADLEPGDYESVCVIPGDLLNIGEYFVTLWAGMPGVKYFLKPAEFMKISVSGIGNHGSMYPDYQKWPGVVCPSIEWKINRQIGSNENA